MAEDPNEDSWLYGGPPNADETAEEKTGGETHVEGLKSAEAANEEKLAPKTEATTDPDGNNEEDDGFKEDEDFQKIAANPADDDPFEDDAVSVYIAT